VLVVDILFVLIVDYVAGFVIQISNAYALSRGMMKTIIAFVFLMNPIHYASRAFDEVGIMFQMQNHC